MGRRRKQRVVLRKKRREVLTTQLRNVAVRGGILLVSLGLIVLLFTRGNSLGVSFMQRHTPEIITQAPLSMAGLPVADAWPQHRFWLWFPFVQSSCRQMLVKRHAELRTVDFDNQYLSNRIVVRLQPRVPLVQWDSQAMDKEGSLFPLSPALIGRIPKVIMGNPKTRSPVAAWLNELSHVPELWPRIVEVNQNAQGDMILKIQTGAQVTWGMPDIASAREKAHYLSWVLGDAHSRLGGAAAADMRFFEDGRIVVRPK